MSKLHEKLEALAREYDLPSITTWRQGEFIDSPRYSHMDEEWKEESRAYERSLIRPHGGTNNALFRVLGTESPANIVAYLQALGKLLDEAN